MKTRIIHTKIWDDDFFQGLTLTQKALFIYLMTNSLIGLTGIYELSDRRIRFDTGIEQDELEKTKQILENAGKVCFKNSWVYIVNAQKYGGYTSPKLNDPIKREVARIPVEILKSFNDYAFNHSVSIQYAYTTDTPINHKSEIINDKPETINQKEGEGYQKFQEIRAKLAESKRMN